MDLNRRAFDIVSALTGEKKTENLRSAAARNSGRLGGPARAQALSAERRREIAVIASSARWKGKQASGTELREKPGWNVAPISGGDVWH